MLFSATIPEAILKIAATEMKLPVHIEVAPSGTAAEGVSQELFIVKKQDKKRILGKLLEQYRGSVLLFSRTKIGAKKITTMLRNMGHKAAEIHSDRTLGQRKEALEGFKRGRYRILVATDIAARGIDVTGIELVINYDLPDDTENYVHRIGRTGRAGLEGRAISFATPEQGSDVRNIENLIKTPLPVLQHPELPSEKFITAVPKKGGRRPFSGGRKKIRERMQNTPPEISQFFAFMLPPPFPFKGWIFIKTEQGRCQCKHKDHRTPLARHQGFRFWAGAVKVASPRDFNPLI